VIATAFKAGDSALRGSNGGFDSHTLPPTYLLSTTHAASLVSNGTFVPIGVFSPVFMPRAGNAPRRRNCCPGKQARKVDNDHAVCEIGRLKLQDGTALFLAVDFKSCAKP
jgi:hypothetical protein